MTVHPAQVLRYCAFSPDPNGGNPAGVVLDADGLDAPTMQAIAADVGYSETAFVSSQPATSDLRIRYFSPEHEVPFCGRPSLLTVDVPAGAGTGVQVSGTAVEIPGCQG